MIISLYIYIYCYSLVSLKLKNDLTDLNDFFFVFFFSLYIQGYNRENPKENLKNIRNWLFSIENCLTNNECMSDHNESRGSC